MNEAWWIKNIINSLNKKMKQLYYIEMYLYFCKLNIY